MTANGTRRPRDRTDGPTDECAFRRAVPMAGTGEGPRPDATTFAPTRPSEDTGETARTAGGRPSASNRTASNRAADDATTQ